MLLGQVAVALRGKHIDQTSGIFQQRLFHPTSNLDGNIVREMAAKTGVSVCACALYNYNYQFCTCTMAISLGVYWICTQG